MCVGDRCLDDGRECAPVCKAQKIVHEARYEFRWRRYEGRAYRCVGATTDPVLNAAVRADRVSRHGFGLHDGPVPSVNVAVGEGQFGSPEDVDHHVQVSDDLACRGVFDVVGMLSGFVDAASRHGESLDAGRGYTLGSGEYRSDRCQVRVGVDIGESVFDVEEHVGISGVEGPVKRGRDEHADLAVETAVNV